MAVALTKTQEDEFKEAFSLFDKDEDCRITSTDLRVVMGALGQDPTEAEVKDLINEVHNNKNGELDCEAFLSLMTLKTSETNANQELADIFNVFDRDKNGAASAADLQQVMTSFGEKLTLEEVAEMVREVDGDGDGRVNFDEFVKLALTK